MNVHNSRILIVSCYSLCLYLDTNPEKPSEGFILPKSAASQWGLVSLGPVEDPWLLQWDFSFAFLKADHLSGLCGLVLLTSSRVFLIPQADLWAGSPMSKVDREWLSATGDILVWVPVQLLS